MNLLEATRNSLNKTFDYKTRSRRSEYWGFILSAFLVCFLLGFLDKLFFGATWPLKETIIVYDTGLTTKSYGITTNYGPISKTVSILLLYLFWQQQFDDYMMSDLQGLF